MKKLLVLNGSSSEIMLIKAAKRLGYYVITSGNNPSLVGHKYSDEYQYGDFSNHDEMIKLAKKIGIDAVVGNANDLGLLTSIRIAEELGLPGIRDKYEVSRVFHEKDLFKKLAENCGFRTPKSVMFDSEDDAIEYMYNSELPLMVKPVDLSAGRGVSQVEDYMSGIKAIKDAFELSKAKRIVIEEYLPGRQYDFHTIIINKKVVFYSASNEFSFKNPYQVSCLTIPADHSESISRMLIDDIEKMAETMDIADGPLWVQYRIKNDKPYIIESARRCGGNNMLDILSKGYNFDFGEWVVRLETGMDYNTFTEPLVHTNCQAYQSLMAPCDGKIKEIYIDDDLKKHIYQQYYWYKQGEEVTNYLYERWGIILFEYEKQEEMMSIATRIDDLARVVMEK